MIEHPRTIPRQPRGSAGVNLQQYTPKTTPKKPGSTSPGPQPQPPALPGQWLPAFIWMPAAPGIMPGSPPPMVPSMFQQGNVKNLNHPRRPALLPKWFVLKL